MNPQKNGTGLHRPQNTKSRQTKKPPINPNNAKPPTRRKSYWLNGRMVAMNDGDFSARPVKSLTDFITPKTADNICALHLPDLRRSDPYPGEYGDQSEDKIGRDRLADQLGGEQPRRDRVDGHGVGHAGWRRALKRHYP